jgi:protein TonB
MTGVAVLCVSLGAAAQDTTGGAAPAQEPATRQSSAAPLIPPKPTQIRVSQGVTQGLLLKKVQPKYPKEARKQHVQGSVLLHAVIDKTGNIAELSLISGDPLLVKAAMDAVKKWRYRPYLIQGEPFKVLTEIMVNFTLSQ